MGQSCAQITFVLAANSVGGAFVPAITACELKTRDHVFIKLLGT